MGGKWNKFRRAAKKLWAEKTPEQRREWVEKIQAGRAVAAARRRSSGKVRVKQDKGEYLPPYSRTSEGEVIGTHATDCVEEAVGVIRRILQSGGKLQIQVIVTK